MADLDWRAWADLRIEHKAQTVARAYTQATAVYIVAALNATERLLDMHVRDEYDRNFCQECGHGYPCATARALGVKDA